MTGPALPSVYSVLWKLFLLNGRLPGGSRRLSRGARRQFLVAVAEPRARLSGVRLRVEFTTEPFDLDEAPRACAWWPARSSQARRAGRRGRRPVRQHRRGRRGRGARPRWTPCCASPCEAGATRVSLQVNVIGRAGQGEGTRRDGPADHPFVAAVKPLVDAMGGEMVAPDQARATTSSWPGRARTSWPYGCPHLSDSLDHILAELERRHGMPLAELDRKAKQAVVRILEARGAFSVRHGVETVAGALGRQPLHRLQLPEQGERVTGRKAAGRRLVGWAVGSRVRRPSHDASHGPAGMWLWGVVSAWVPGCLGAWRNGVEPGSLSTGREATDQWSCSGLQRARSLTLGVTLPPRRQATHSDSSRPQYT